MDTGKRQTEERKRAALCPRCGLRRPPAETCRLCDVDPEPPSRSVFPPFDLAAGFLAFWEAALGCLTSKQYLGKILWAVLWNAIVFCALGALALFLIHGWVSDLATGLPDWLSGISIFAGTALALLVTLAVSFYIFPVLFSLFLFPFLDPLARLAEEESLGWLPPESTRGFWGDFWDSIDTGARILLWQSLAFVITLPFTLSAIGFPIVLVVSGFFIGFAWLDYPLTRRGIPYRQKWRIAKRNWARLIGFGLAFELGLCIPFFGLFFVCPTAAIGSARLFFGAEPPPSPLEPVESDPIEA